MLLLRKVIHIYKAAYRGEKKKKKETDESIYF